MFKNDYLLDMAESLGRALGKGIKHESQDVLPISIENMSDKDMLVVRLKHLIEEGKFNDAENSLFDFLQGSNCTLSIIEVGQWFYTQLAKKTSAELATGNFSEDEIVQGLNDFKVAFGDKFGI